jgi:hypothetical protein
LEALAVEFPLRGQHWVAPNTPGHRVPSHGTDFGGQAYAYDFVQVDPRFPGKWRVSKKPFLASLVFGIPLEDCLGWGQPIHAPFAGVVVEAEDGVAERNPVHVGRDSYVALRNAISYKGAKHHRELRRILGNYVILEGADAFALLAHARRGSVCVRPGDRVETGQKLAEVGHSGNSTAPHLHFQLMDRPELLQAKGLPCCFKRYERLEDGAWKKVENGIPQRTDRIRVLEGRAS